MLAFLNTIAHSDCIQLLRRFPDASIDLLLTDPRSVKADLRRSVTSPGFKPYASSNGFTELRHENAPNEISGDRLIGHPQFSGRVSH